MGLAASQARLLFITSRQSDVSAQMQRISQQNIVLARDSEEVSNTYDRMLASAEANETTSTSSSSGTNLVASGSSPANLSYAYMMGETGATSGKTPYILTDTSNRVVLNSSMATRLGLSGTGTGKEFQTKITSAESFLQKVASSEVANAYRNSANGSAYQASVSINSLFSSMSSRNYVTPQSINPGSEEFNSLARSNNAINVFSESSDCIVAYYADDTDLNKCGDWKNGRYMNITKKGKTLQELYNSAGSLSGCVMLGSTPQANDSSYGDISGIKTNLGNLVNSIGSQLTTGLAGLGLNAEAVSSAVKTSTQSVSTQYLNNIYWDEGKGSEAYNNSTKWKAARASAQKCITDMGGTWGNDWSQVFDDGAQKYDESAVAIGMMAASNLSGIVATRTFDEGNYNTWQFTVNAGNLVKDIVEDLFTTLSKSSGDSIYTEADYGGNKSVDCDKKVTLKLTAPSGGSSDENTTKANYYLKIYEQLCSNGWTVDADADDMNKLQEKIKNYTYKINGNNYTNSDSVDEVSDSSSSSSTTYTKEQAERYYEREKSKIQRKEKQLEQELTKLQTEYSSLTNDYNSVKSIIDANVQKSFQYCQTG